MTDTETLRAGMLVLHKGVVRTFNGQFVLQGVPEARISGPGVIGYADPKALTPIGHPDDGWRIHEGDTCPVPPDARVECVWANGDQRWGVCGEWKGWAEQGKRRIVAYRLAPQAAGAGCEHTWSSSKLGEPPVFCTKCFMPKVVLAGGTSPHHTALVEAFKAGASWTKGRQFVFQSRDRAATAYANEHAPVVRVFDPNNPTENEKVAWENGVNFAAEGRRQASKPAKGTYEFAVEMEDVREVLCTTIVPPAPEDSLRPIAASELREGDRVRVTVEGVVDEDGDVLLSEHCDSYLWGNELHAQDYPNTIHLLSREPESLKLHDRVQLPENTWSGTGVIVWMKGSWAAVQASDDEKPVVKPLFDLRRIDAEGGDHG